MSDRAVRAFAAAILGESPTTSTHPQSQPLLFGTVVEGGIQLDAPETLDYDSPEPFADATLLEDHADDLLSIGDYQPGDRVALTLDAGGAPIILGREDGLADSDLLNTLQQGQDGTNEAVAEQSQVLVSHKEHMDEIDEVISDVGDAISSWENRIPAVEADVSDAKSRALDAQEAALNALTKANQSVSGTTVEYAVGASESVAPVSGWSTSQPNRVPGSFVWMRSVISKADGSSSTTAAVLLTGNAGAPGSDGQDGVAGQKGQDGRGVADAVTTYQVSTSGTSAPTTWQASIPTIPAGQYLWTRVVTTYTDSSTSTAYSVSRSGTNGSNGTPGAAGVDGRTPFLHVAYATNSTGTTGFSTTDPTGRTYMGTCTDFTEADPTTPGSYEWVLIKGADGSKGDTGAAGRGIKSTTVTYQASSSGTTAPTGTWSASIPVVSPSQYLWTRTILVFTDDATTTTYSVGMMGAQGPKGDAGAKGAAGADGRGITSSTTAYAVAASGTTAPTTGWQSSVPTVPQGQYLWSRLVVQFSDATQTTTYQVARMGADGTPGSSGAKGDKGDQGAAGRGVASVSVGYQTGSSGTTVPTGSWITSVPVTPQGQFLWTRTTTTYTDATTSVQYSVARAGTDGAPGAKGDQGVSVTDVRALYKQLPDSELPPPAPTAFLGNLYPDPDFALTYTNWVRDGAGIKRTGSGTQAGVYMLAAAMSVTEETDYRLRIRRENLAGTSGDVALFMQHSTAETGSMTNTWPGVGRVSTVSEPGVHEFPIRSTVAGIKRAVIGFYTQANMTAATTVRLSEVSFRLWGGWEETEPAYVEGTALYRTELVTFSNGQYAYTPVSQVSGYQGVAEAIFLANFAQAVAEGLITAGPEEPDHATGRVWLKTDEDGKLTGIYQSNAGVWEQYALMTGMLIVPGADGTPTIIDQDGMVIGQIMADAITGKSIAAATISARELMLASIPKDRLSSGVQGTLTSAADLALRTLLEPGRITIAAVPVSGGVALSATIIEPAKIDFVVEGKSVAYIDGPREVMSIKNAYVRDTLVVGEHQAKTVAPGITAFSWVGAAGL